MPIGVPYIERETADGVKLKFRKLHPFCQAEVLRREKARQRAVLLQDAKDTGLDKVDTINALRDFGKEIPQARDFGELFDSPAGKADIYDLAGCDLVMESTGIPKWTRRADAAENDNYICSISHVDATTLAAEICRVTLGVDSDDNAPVDDTYGDGGENPTRGTATTEKLPIPN